MAETNKSQPKPTRKIITIIDNNRYTRIDKEKLNNNEIYYYYANTGKLENGIYIPFQPTDARGGLYGEEAKIGSHGLSNIQSIYKKIEGGGETQIEPKKSKKENKTKPPKICSSQLSSLKNYFITT